MLRILLPGRPYGAAVTATGQFVRSWIDWFDAVLVRLNASPFRVQTVRLTAQGAAVTTTSVPIAGMTAGLYRVSYAMRVTRAATTSSSATMTLGWTDGAVACAQAFAAMTGNTTATTQTGTLLVPCDQDGPLTYAVAYASVGATAMQYQCDVVVEFVPGVAS